MPYSHCAGEYLTVSEILDPEEQANYDRARAERAHYRLATFARTGVLPPATGERTEEAAQNAYERWLTGDQS